MRIWTETKEIKLSILKKKNVIPYINLNLKLCNKEDIPSKIQT